MPCFSVRLLQLVGQAMSGLVKLCPEFDSSTLSSKRYKPAASCIRTHGTIAIYLACAIILFPHRANTGVSCFTRHVEARVRERSRRLAVVARAPTLGREIEHPAGGEEKVSHRADHAGRQRRTERLQQLDHRLPHVS